MSAPKEPVRGEDLMLLHDGELPPARAREVAERVAASPEAQAQKAGLDELAALTRAHYEAAASESDAQLAAAWAKLEGQLDAPIVRPASVAAAVGPSGGVWAWLGDVLRPRLGYALAGALGAAAGALLVAKLGRGPIQMVPMDVPVVVQVHGGPSGTVMASAPIDTEVEVDVPRGSAMVFPVAGEGSDRPATVVIWVTDDAPMEGPI